MFTLIKREIIDHIMYFIGAAILSIGLMAILVTMAYNDYSGLPFVVILFLILTTIGITIGICAMGVSQMYSDRTRKISALLSTLPVSRNQILLARVVTGIMAVLIALVPVAVTGAVLMRIFFPPEPVEIFPGLIRDMFIGIFLLGFACYCIGLQNGWEGDKVAPTLGSLALVCILVPIIVVKGFGVVSVVILAVFIAASLIRTWCKFLSTSL